MQWISPCSAFFNRARADGRSKFFPLQPSSQNSRISAFPASGIPLKKPLRRFLWFAILFDSRFAAFSISLSSSETRRYIAMVSLSVFMEFPFVCTYKIIIRGSSFDRTSLPVSLNDCIFFLPQVLYQNQFSKVRKAKLSIHYLTNPALGVK